MLLKKPWLSWMNRINKRLYAIARKFGVELSARFKVFFAREEKIFYLFILFFYFLEIGIFSRFRFLGVMPNLILLLLVFYCFYFNYSVTKIVLFSFTCAVVKDLSSSGAFGTQIIIFVLLGVVIGFIARRFSKFEWVFIIVLFLIAVAGEGLIYAAIQKVVFDNNISLPTLFIRILFWELIYTLSLFLISFKVIKKCVIEKLA